MECTICAIAKHENPYLREWVEHHLNIGYDHIYIYDNNEINYEPINYLLEDYIKDNKVTVADFRGCKYLTKNCYGDHYQKLVFNTPSNLQLDVYNHFYQVYGKNYDWITYIDIDEFITLDKEQYSNIKELFSNNIFDEYNIIFFLWKIIQDNGEITVQDDNYSITRFTEESDNKSDISFKGTIRGNIEDLIITMAHLFIYEDDRIKGCNTNGYPMKNCPHTLENIDTKNIIKHYRFKTITEFMCHKKMRGYTDNNEDYVPLSIDFFSKFNRTKDIYGHFKIKDTFKKAEYIESGGIILTAVVNNITGNLKDWIDIHLKIGFDHIRLYNTLEYTHDELNQIIGEYPKDVISVVDCRNYKGIKKYYNSLMELRSELELFNHCYQGIGCLYNFIALGDINYYFLPTDKNWKKIINSDIYLNTNVISVVDDTNNKALNFLRTNKGLFIDNGLLECNNKKDAFLKSEMVHNLAFSLNKELIKNKIETIYK